MNTKCVCAEINSRNCPVHQNNDSWEEEFNELTNPPDDLSYQGTKQWLETNKTLCSDYVYPESIVELDGEKVKAFIKDQITKAEKRGYVEGYEERGRLEEMTGMPDVLKGQSTKDSSDMPELVEMTEIYELADVGESHIGGVLICREVNGKIIYLDKKYGVHKTPVPKEERLSEEPKVTTDAQITKAQQEIAEQIIEDIPDIECRGCNLIYGCECEPLTIDELKSQLRKKYLL